MALTPASVLADYSSGIGTQGATLQIKTEDKRVGIGTTNPQGTLQVGTAITMGSGIVTATSFDASTASFSGNVSVGGTLTYEDVTNVDSVGIVTARSNVIVGGGLSVTGISTFNGITTSTTTLFANNFSVSGVSTLGGNVVVGGATTELVVTGDARVTGILTVGTASFTIDGTVAYPTTRPTLDLNFAASKTLDRRITLTRDGVGTYTDELGVIRYASSNVPRFDHDVSTGESLGLLIEEQRTNLIPYSEEFTSWTYTTNVSTASTVAPDGTTNGVEMIENTSNAQHNFEQTISSTGTFVYSIWAKQGSGSRNFGVTSYNATDGDVQVVYNLSTGAKVSGSNDTTITAYPDGWYRITLKVTTTAATSVYAQILDGTTASYTGDGSSSIRIWGAQVEIGDNATTYIPTAGSTVTRGPDKAFANHIDQEPWFNATEGTLVFENTDVTVGEASVDYPAIGFGQSPNGSSDQAIQIFWATTGNIASFLLRTTGESDILFNFASGSTAGSKWSFVYKENDIALARNGSVVHTISSAVLPSNFFTLILGVNNMDANDQYLNGHIKRLTYYPKRLPNAQLQGLTA